MALKALADICVNNNEFRFKAFWTCSELYPEKWDINQRISTKAVSGYPLGKSKLTTVLCIASEFSDAFFVVKLLQNGANANLRDETGNTCFHLAARSKNHSSEKILVLNSHEPNLIGTYNMELYYPIHTAVLANNHEALSAMICCERFKINVKQKGTNYTALHIAAKKGYVSAIKVLLSHRDINVNSLNSDGNTVLHLSVIQLHPVTYATLKEHALCDTSVRNRQGWSAAQLLYLKFLEKSFSGGLSILKTFVEQFKIPCTNAEFTKTPLHNACLSSIEAVDKIKYLVHVDRMQLSRRFHQDESLPIHMAAMNQNSSVLKCILEVDLNADPNVKRCSSRKGRKQHVTPLHISCYHGFQEHVQALLTNPWTDVNVRDGTLNTPLHTACQEGHLHIILLLKSEPQCRTNIRNSYGRVADDCTPHGVRVHEIAQTGYAFELHELLRNPKRLLYDTHSENALHKVCYSKSDTREKAIMLIDKETGLLFAFDEQGLTPFHTAIQLDQLELVNYFIHHCKNNIKTRDGRSLLHIACEFDRSGIVKVLIANVKDIGTHINERDMRGNTPAHLAAQHFHVGALEVIQDHPAYNANIPNAAGRTADQVNPINRALLRECKHGRVDAVKSLIKAGATSITDEAGNSVYHIIYNCSIDRPEKYEIVSNAFPEVVNHANDEGWTILHRSCEDGDVQFVRHMMHNDNLRVNVKDQLENMPIHKVIENGSVGIVRILVENKAAVNVRNYLGRTPTHQAAQNNKIDILWYLLSLPNVEVNTKDRNGNSPWKSCCKYSNPFARMLIENHKSFEIDADVRSFWNKMDSSSQLPLLVTVTGKTWTQQQSFPLSVYPYTLRVIGDELWLCHKHGIDVYANNLILIKNIHFEDMYLVHDVAAYTDKILVIAANSGLYHAAYDVSSNVLCVPQKTDLKRFKIGKGYFTSVVVYSGLVYAADWRTSSVHVLQRRRKRWQLQHLIEITKDIPKDNLFLSISNNSLFVNKRDKGRLYAYTLTGVLLGTYGDIGRNHPGQMSYSHICGSDKEGAVMVASVDGRLQTMDNAGMWSVVDLQPMVKHLRDAVLLYDKLVVLCRDPQCIYVYS